MTYPRLDIEPMSVVERRHIEKALDACEGNVTLAARLLGIGRSTLFRKRQEFDSGLRESHRIRVPWPDVKPPNEGVLEHRRRVEEALEMHGGRIRAASIALGVTPQRVCYSLERWHKDNERMVRQRARKEGISDDEIEVIMRRRTVREHAERCEMSVSWAYQMIDEACAILGLRRYRNWLFLA